MGNNNGLLAAAIIGGIVLLSKKQASGQDNSGVEIMIYDENGQPVPHNSPFALDEGRSYTVQVSVTNTSTRGGEPCEADLTIETRIYSDKMNYLPLSSKSQLFTKGQSVVFNYPFATNYGESTTYGNVSVMVKDPDGNVLISAMEYFTVAAVAIVYGASVSIR